MATNYKHIQRAHYAGFWRRLGATLLDMVLFISLLSPVLYLVYGQEYFAWAQNHSLLLQTYAPLEFLLNKVLAVILLLVFWHINGATPGKRLLHCRVVDAATGSPLTWRQALLRILGYAVSILTFYIGFLWIALDKRKQGLHDKIARTAVIYHEDDYAAQSLEKLMEATS